MPTVKTSFRDGRHTHFGFLGAPILVVCPRCAGRAVVATGFDKMPADTSRLTCSNCGLARSAAPVLNLQYDRDPVFGLELWLTAQTQHGLLCCYHEEHLALFEAFIPASLRERDKSTRSWHNASYISRLPARIKAAKNRPDLLRACAKLRLRLGSGRIGDTRP